MDIRKEIIIEARKEVDKLIIKGTNDASNKIIEIYERYMYNMFRKGYIEGYNHGLKDGIGTR